MLVLTPSSSAYRFWGANWQTSFHLVLRPKPRNHYDDFEAQITKQSTMVLRPKPRNCRGDFEAQITKLSPPILRLNQEIRAPRLLHVYDVDRTQRHLTSWSSGHRVPDLCMIIPDSLHQVSYSCLDPHRCPPCRIHHLHITRQANTFLQTEWLNLGLVQLKSTKFKFKLKEVNYSSHI
jgi:hypothetical protein